jgi:hypothetical protein
MAAFDFSTEAELSPAGSAADLSPAKIRRGRQPIGYGRFARSADAIRFAIEELSPDLLLGASLQVGQKKFDGDAMRRLYESAEYPLARRPASRWALARSR